jgi:hypothetical protein
MKQILFCLGVLTLLSLAATARAQQLYVYPQ